MRIFFCGNTFVLKRIKYTFALGLSVYSVLTLLFAAASTAGIQAPCTSFGKCQRSKISAKVSRDDSTIKEFTALKKCRGFLYL